MKHRVLIGAAILMIAAPLLAQDSDVRVAAPDSMRPTKIALGTPAPPEVEKVAVCHRPPGNKDNFRIITIGAPAVPSHLAHGDNVVAEELCNGVDDDCDGVIDNGVCICGNGVVEPGEQCETSANCPVGFRCEQCACVEILPECGNGVIEPGEQCEANGDCAAGYECVDCQCRAVVPVCGNGVLEPGEQCEAASDCGAGYACVQCRCVGTGDVRVSLSWGDTNDLDLHVYDPSGEEIYYGHRTSASGGVLDVDTNAACGNTTTNAVENVYWPVGGAPTGTYVVKVNYWAYCGMATESAFTVTTVVDGVTTQYPGVIGTVSRCSACDVGCVCQFIVSFTR